MKKVLKVIGVIIGAFIAFVLIAGLFVSKDFHYETSIAINAPIEKVWDQVSNLNNHANWSPWEKKDPNMVKTFSGTPGTVGSVMSWKGNKDVGIGSQTITSLTPMTDVQTLMKFKEPFETESTAFFKLLQGKDGVQITWGFDSKYPYPFNVSQLLFDMKKMMDKDFVPGLQKLKTVCETQSSTN